MARQQGVNLTIKGVESEDFRFVSLQLTEAVGAVLPKLIATYISGSSSYPLDLQEVELTLSYLDYINLTFVANVDQIDFGQNDVTLYMTVAPAEFYQLSRSNSFLSLDEAIKNLYWGENIESDISDTTPIEFNQVNLTDSKTIFRALSSLQSPSCYAFNLGRLKITDLNDPKPNIVIDIKSKTNYKVEGSDNTILKGKIKRLPYYTSAVTDRDGVITTSLISWGDKTIHLNTALNGMVENIMDNAKFYDRGDHAVRVTFMYLPEFMCGDIISIKLKDIDPTEFLVVERIAIMKEDVTVSALLKPLV